MKIFTVVEYIGERSRIIDVYASRSAAIERCVRLGNARDQSDPNQRTYHIITKSVLGLAGIKMVVKGKVRYIEATRRK